MGRLYFYTHRNIKPKMNTQNQKIAFNRKIIKDSYEQKTRVSSSPAHLKVFFPSQNEKEPLRFFLDETIHSDIKNMRRSILLSRLENLIRDNILSYQKFQDDTILFSKNLKRFSFRKNWPRLKKIETTWYFLDFF